MLVIDQDVQILTVHFNSAVIYGTENSSFSSLLNCLTSCLFDFQIAKILQSPIKTVLLGVFNIKQVA